MRYLQFSDLKVGEKFLCNGNYCTKKSARTAYIDKTNLSLWFYFGQKESISKGW